ncbi:MAG TPA: SBBP repeat-containing protein, partial [Vicinamibacteria bacterium]|nr:SBBP repeat-containing protein [Vicinamibacteria bacterium]
MTTRTAVLAGILLWGGAGQALAQNAGWPQRFGGSSDETATAVARDSAGNVYTAGYFQGQATFGPTVLTSTSPGQFDIFVAMMSKNGDWVWAVRAGGTLTDRAEGVAVDPNGNVYVSGSFQGTAAFGGISRTATDTDIFVAKLDAGGNFRWVAQVAGSGEASGLDLGVIYNENVYLAGYFTGTATFKNADNTNSAVGSLSTSSNHATDTDALVGKINESGNWVWAVKAGGDLGATDQDCLQGRYCCAAFDDCNFWDPFFSYDFQEQLCRSYFGGDDGAAQAIYGRPRCVILNAYSQDQASALRVVATEPPPGQQASSQPKIFVGGHFQGTFRVRNGGTNINGTPLNAAGNRSQDLYVAKLVDEGSSARWIWHKDAGHLVADGATAKVEALDVDKDSNIYVTGSYTGQPTFDGTTATAAPAGHTRVFVARMGDDLQPTFQWSQTAGAPSGVNASAAAFGVAVDASSPGARGVYVSGRFAERAEFPSSPAAKLLVNHAPGKGTTDVFVARMPATCAPAPCTPPWTWATQGGYLFSDESLALASDAAGTTVVAGRFQGGGKFVSGPLFTFDGVADFAQGTMDVSETSYAASLWFKTTTRNGGLISVVSADGGHDRHIYLNNGNLCARVWNDETICTVNQDFADDTWHNVVHTFGGAVGGQRLYVDGVRRSVNVRIWGYSCPAYSWTCNQPNGYLSSSNFTWQTDVRVGYSADSGAGLFFAGQLQNVEILDAAMTEAQALTRYSAYLATANAAAEGQLLFGRGARDGFVASVNPGGVWREFEKWAIGQAVPAPDAAKDVVTGKVLDIPEVEVAVGDWKSYFFWSPFNGQLYPTAEVAAVIKWKVSRDVQDTRRIESNGSSRWPKQAIAHVVGVPVEVAPAGRFTFDRIAPHGTAGASVTDPVPGGAQAVPTRTFNAAQPGYSVLIYADGTAP